MQRAEGVAALRELSAEEAGALLCRLLGPAEDPVTITSDDVRAMQYALRRLPLHELLDVVRRAAVYLTPEPTHGLSYVSRDGRRTWWLDREQEPTDPPSGAELVVLEALMRFSHARVLRWANKAATTPEGT